MSVTYALRTSGGDFSSLDTLITHINSTDFTGANHTLQQDVIVEVQGGQTFGTSVTTNRQLGAGAGTWNWAGFTITFKTKPAEVATPATLLGVYGLAPQTQGTAGNFVLLDLILRAEGLSSTFGAFIVVSGVAAHIIVSIRNCILYLKATAATIGIIDASGVIAFANCLVNDCSIFCTGGSQLTALTFGGSDATPVNNTLVCFFSTGTVLTHWGAVSTNNTVFNYSSGALTFAHNGSNLTQGTNPNLVSSVIQAFNETTATMAGRSALLTASSAACLDNADAATSESTDIYGTVRPQGSASDRGANEFISSSSSSSSCSSSSSSSFSSHNYSFPEYIQQVAIGQPIAVQPPVGTAALVHIAGVDLALTGSYDLGAAFTAQQVLDSHEMMTAINTGAATATFGTTPLSKIPVSK